MVQDRPDPLLIPQAERDVIRAFTLDNTAPDAAALLGLPGLDPGLAEVVAVADLGGLGLAGYLTEGHEVPAEVLADDLPRLAVVTGHVLLLRSPTLDRAQRLVPAPGVVPLGAWRQTSGAPAQVWPLAEPDPVPPLSSPVLPPSPLAARHWGGLVLVTLLVVVAALLLWLAR